jgi:hypothetical protein
MVLPRLVVINYCRTDLFTEFHFNDSDIAESRRREVDPVDKTKDSWVTFISRNKPVVPVKAKELKRFSNAIVRKVQPTVSMDSLSFESIFDEEVWWH